jgi:phosphomannomutase
MSQIKFGTDGWRAIIAEDFTMFNLERVAQATADYWKASPPDVAYPDRVVVGYDRRFLSDQFAQRTAEVLAGNGFQVTLTDSPTPTPAISQAVVDLKSVGGVMITASHNPPAFNGFKLKAHYGGSAEPEMCRDIESRLDQSKVQKMDFEEAKKKKRILIKNIRPAHYRAIKKRVDFDLIAKSGLRFAHDAMYGVGAGCFDELLAGTSCKVTTLNGEHNPGFGGINPEPIPKNYAASSAWLKKNPHDICLVTDGDADRVGGMDGSGGMISTHQIICLLLRHYFVNRNARGRMVKALTATSMVDDMCKDFGLELVETGVGFKYICAEMLKGDVILGAEESGGIGFQNHIPERDGILAGMALLEMLAMEGKTINQLIASLNRKYGARSYSRIDAHFPLEKRPDLMEFCANNAPNKLLKSPVASVKSFDGVKYQSEDGSWLMLRGSGTEPILRIYAEAPDAAGAEKLLKLGVKMTKQV